MIPVRGSLAGSRAVPFMLCRSQPTNPKPPCPGTTHFPRWWLRTVAAELGMIELPSGQPSMSSIMLDVFYDHLVRLHFQVLRLAPSTPMPPTN